MLDETDVKFNLTEREGQIKYFQLKFSDIKYNHVN